MILAHLLPALALAAAPAIDEGPGTHPNLVQEIVLKDARAIAKADKVAYAAHKLRLDEGVKLPPFEPAAPFQRYFRVTTGKSQRNNFLVTFCVHLNLLSVRKSFAWPAFVAPDVLRIDVRDYGWDENGRGGDNVLVKYETLAKRDPVFHQQATVLKDGVTLDVAWPGGYDARQEKEYGRGVYEVTFAKGRAVPRPAAWLDQDDADELRKILCTEVPILDAEFLFGQTARQQSIYGEADPGFAYYDALAIRDRDAYFALTGADPKLAKKLNRRVKGAVAKSKVGRHSRLVFEEGAIARAVWGTFDTADPRDRGNLLRNLRDGEFVHQAEEWFGFLPNDLPVTLLSNAAGARQATAPDNVIGSDRSKLAKDSDARYQHNDTPVHTNLSCLRCHGPTDMLMDVDDQIRKAFKQGGPLLLVDPDKRVTRELQDEYLSDLDGELKRGREVYAKAVKKVTTSKLNPDGWTVPEFAKHYSETFDRYAYAPITPDVAARELGVPKKKLMDGIKAHAGKFGRGQTDIALASWLADESDGMSRTIWEQATPLAMSLAMGLSPPETVERKKVKP